jgi:hypothetical protein
MTAAPGPVQSRTGSQTPAPGAAVCLAPILVRTEPGAVAGFSRETAKESNGFVPLTFPFCWLTLPEIRSEILQMIGGEKFIPVHEAQSFVYDRELQIDTDYILAIELSHAEKPPRVILRMAISSPSKEVCAHLETVLRIVPLTATPAA